MLSNFIMWLEQVAQKPLYLFFNISSRLFSYTSALALTTSLGGFLIAVYIAIFMAETLQFDVSGTKDQFIYLFGGLVLFFYAPGYYLHFGILHRIGLPAFTKNLNMINNSIKKNELFVPEDEEEAQRLLRAMQKLPGDNMLAALIYPTIVMIAVVIQELFIGSQYNTIMMFVSIASAIYLYVFYTYIMGELLTGSMRRKLMSAMVDRNIHVEEAYMFSIRNKFMFLTTLILIAMGELGYMVFIKASQGFSIVPIIYIGLTVFIVSSLLFFYMVSIQQSLIEIEQASLDLASGGSGRLFIPGLDKEMVVAGKGFSSAAQEVTELRTNLERIVGERTNDLNNTLEELKKKEKLLEDEMQVASRIQAGIMPPTPITRNGLNIIAHHQSMEEIGGDLYDIIPMRNSCVGILIADVSGHGIPAALVTTMAKISFIQATQNCLSPKRIFSMVNDSLVSTVKTQEYLTAFFLVVSPSFDILYSNASHRMAQVLRKKDETVEKWDTNGLFLGAISGDDAIDSYEEKTSQVSDGDRIFIYTDGLVEARNPHGEEFGEDRIGRLLLETRKMPLGNAKEYILNSWNAFLGESEINDDVTFVIIEKGASSNDAVSHRDKGQQLLEKGEYRKAEWELMSALKFDNTDALTHQLLGKCHLKTGNYESATQHFKTFLDDNPTDAYTLYLLAASLYNMQDFSRALLNARTADRIRPENPHTLTVMARSLAKLGREDEAKDIWKRLLGLDPNNEIAQQELDKLD